VRCVEVIRCGLCGVCGVFWFVCVWGFCWGLVCVCVGGGVGGVWGVGGVGGGGWEEVAWRVGEEGRQGCGKH